MTNMQTGGDRRNMALLLMQRGLGANAADFLSRNWENYNEDLVLNNRQNFTEEDIASLGVQNTSQKSQEAAQIGNAFTEDMFRGFSKVGAMVGEDIYNKLKDLDWTFMGVNITDGIGEVLKKILSSGEEMSDDELDALFNSIDIDKFNQNIKVEDKNA